MSELEPYSTEAHYRRNIADELIDIVGGEQATPVEWCDDRGTKMELVLDGSQIYYSRQEVGAIDTLSVALDHETGKVSATGSAIDEIERFFGISKQDAAVIFMLGGLATRPDSVHEMKNLQVDSEAGVNGEAELQPISETQLWDRITAIEQLAYEYDPDGYPAHAKDRTAYVSYGNASKYMVDTLSYYETEDRKYLPQITTQWIDPMTFEVLATDQLRLIDDGLAQRIIEPQSLDVHILRPDFDTYAHLSFAIENMFNVLHSEHVAGSESPEV